MISFDKIVKKMLKKWWNIIFSNDILEILDPEKKQKNKTKCSKIIYRLKAEWVILPLKNWVYIIPDSEDRELNDVDLIDKYYVKLLKKYISKEVGAKYFISWKKSLEIHMKNYSFPEKIYIITHSTQKKVLVWNYEIHFKTIAGKHMWKKMNLFSKLSSYVQEREIEWYNFKFAWIELALLEACLVWDIDEWIDVWLINKALKKYRKVLNYEALEDITQYKYILSVNRLKELSRSQSPELYRLCLSIIKKNGWLFVWESARAI